MIFKSREEIPKEIRELEILIAAKGNYIAFFPEEITIDGNFQYKDFAILAKKFLSFIESQHELNA